MPDLDSRYKILSQKKHLKTILTASGGFSIRKVSLPERILKGVTRKVSSQFSAWKLAWAEFGRGKSVLWMKRGAGIVAWFLFTGAGQSAYAAAHYVWPFLPWYGWFLTFFVTTIAAQMFVIHYSAIAYQRIRREEVEKLEDEVWQLEDRLHPKLKISYEGGADDHIVTGHGNEVRHRTIRIRIENTGGKLIEGVKVKAETFLNFGDIPLYDMPLQIAHDVSNDKINGFAISPGDRERADVISKAYGSLDIYLCHALGKAYTAVTHTTDFRVKVRVTALDTTPQEVTLHIFLDDDENLSCK